MSSRRLWRSLGFTQQTLPHKELKSKDVPPRDRCRAARARGRYSRRRCFGARVAVRCPLYGLQRLYV
jgi:hypothetical protein